MIRRTAPDVPHDVRTETFRRDHDDLLDLASELLGGATVELAEDQAASLRRRLGRFGRVLAMHTSLEERVLYPRLFAQPDAGVRRKAHALHASFGTLYGDFLAFAEWWMEEDAIECEPARYVVEVHDVMRRIAERVALETVELYPLVEAVG